MRTAYAVLRSLSKADARTYLSVLAARVMLVIFDIGGIVLLGLSVSLVTGVATSKSSMTGKVLELFEQMGFTNSYLASSLAAVIFFFAKGFGSMALNRYSANKISKIEADQTNALFKAVIRADLSAIEKWTVPKLSQALGFSSEMAFGKSLNSLSIAIGELVLIFTILTLLAVVSLPMFLGLLVFSIAIAGVMSVAVGRKNKLLSSRLSTSMVSASGVIEEAIQNFRQIRATGTEAWFVRKFMVQRRAVAEASNELSVLAVLPRYVTEIALITAIGALVLARSILGDDGLPVSVATIFVAGAFRLVASLLPLQGSLTLLQQIDEASMFALDMREAFLQNRLESIPAAVETRESSFGVAGSVIIEAEGLGFRHSEARKWVLKNLNFTLQAGDFVAITGTSGGGKSTFADLILGLREPCEGDIRIGGMSPTDYLKAHSAGIGYVSQSSYLLSASLLENITLEIGNEKFDKELMARAVKISQLEPLVSELKDGLDTHLGSGAIGLSGGQVQRVALARALYRKPALLILDEATSALDSATEHAVSSALQELAGQVSILAIAHRKSTIESASQVWELRNGSLFRDSSKT